MLRRFLGSAAKQANAVNGVWAPALTRIGKDGRIDSRLSTKHLMWVQLQGCDGVVLFGTTGEANSFSVAERLAHIEYLADADCLFPEHTMVGTGLCNLEETVELNKQATTLGFKNVLVLPPFYYKGVSDDGLFAWYSSLLERVNDPNLRLYFYNFPQLTGVPISPQLLQTTVEYFGNVIAGVKDSSGSWDNMAEYFALDLPVSIFPGSERFLLQGLQAGGPGCITATANFNAQSIKLLYTSFHKGVDEKALQKQNERMMETRTLFEQYPMVAALKCAMSYLDRDPDWLRLRPPLQNLSNPQTVELVRALQL